MRKSILFAFLSFFALLSTHAQQIAYTTVGAATFTTHSSVIELTAQAIGGGGAGAGVNGALFSTVRSAGGGGGAYAGGMIAVSPSTGYTVTVGAGGPNNNSGTAGGNSSFGSLVVAAGGQSVNCPCNSGTRSNNTAASGGLFSSSTGPTRFSGGNGGAGSGNNGGGGGGGAGSTSAGGNGSAATNNPNCSVTSGGGAPGTGLLLSGAGPGRGGRGGYSGAGGNTGCNYGAGGGGASANSNSTRSGGAGFQGIVVVSWSELHSYTCNSSDITIDGLNLLNTSAVTFAGNPTTFTVLSSTQIRIPKPASSGNIIATTDVGKAQIFYQGTSIIPSPNSPICEGSQMTLSGTGTAGYTWSNGITNAVAFTPPLGTTTYTVTGTAGGCSSSASYTVTVNSTPSVNITGSTSFCSGGNTTLTASGGTTYTWSTGASSAAISPSSPGTYTVTAANGICTASDSRLVTELTSPTPNITGTLSYCAGQNTTLTASGGGTYEWSTGASTAAISATAGGYTVTVTAANSCTASTSRTVTENALPTPNITGALSYCAGQNTTLTASGGTSYLWSNGDATAATIVTQGSYTVTVTNASNCTASTSANVTENALPTPNITGVLSYCAGQNTTLTASGGTSYLWSNTDATAATIVSQGSYTVTVTDVNSCTATALATVTENTLPTPLISGALEYCIGQNTTLTASGGSSYLWSNGDATAATTVTQGSYTVTVTDVNSCTATALATVTENALPTPLISGALEYCIGQNTTLTASGGSSYLWSNTDATAATTVTQGSYTVTVTDVNSCTASASAIVTENALPTPLISGALEYCIGQNTTLTASGGTSYLWSNTDATAATTVTQGSYTVTVTDGNSCTATANASVTENAQPTVNISGALSYCAGTNTTLTASGGVSYAWSNSETTAAVDVTQGSYSVTVVDANSCTATGNATVTENALPTPNISGVLEYCAGDNTTLTASGGNDYLWSNGDPTAATTVTQGTYTVTVTDGNSCTASVSENVNENALPTPTISGALSYCVGSNTTLTAAGGDTYLWSNSEITEDITVTQGTYIVTVTDANNCSATQSAVVVENALPIPSISGALEYCVGQNTTLTATGGTAYSWSNTETTASIDVTQGIYSVTVTNANFCTATASATVDENPLPTPVISGALEYCAGDSTVLTASGGTDYLWSNGEISALVNVTQGNYTVTVTDGNSCTATASATVIENALPTPAISGALAYCIGDSTTLTASGGTSYLWSNSDATAASTVTQGSYTVTVTDVNSCSATAVATVTENALPTPLINGALEYCIGQNTTLTASGGTSYLWSNSDATAATTVTQGNYTVTVTDVNSCSAIAAASVTENALPTAAISGALAYCIGDSTTLIASGGVDYLWSNGAVSASVDVTQGSYTVTVTDGNSCTATAEAIVTENSLPTAAISGTLTHCFGSSTVLTASGGTDYLWSNGAITDTTTLSQGNYDVTVTDANACSISASATVTEVGPSVTINSTDPSCGLSNGQATANATGSSSYTYAWSSSSNLATISSLAPGSYTVTVTDNQSCTASASVTLASSGNPTLNFTSNDPNCNQSADGSITLTASGGAGGYSYTWSPSVSTASIASGLTAGTYNVTVSDANNCSGTNTITLSDPSAIVANTSSTSADCGQANGSVFVAASGGTGSLSYSWSTGNNTADVINVVEGFYTVTVSDAAFCSVVRTANVGVNLSTPVYGFKMTDTLLCFGTPYTLSAAQPNAVSYLWSTGATTPEITVTTAGNYSVEVRGACNSVIESVEIEYQSCECDVAVPSAFTPNGDGNNDEFGAINNCVEIQSFELRVFNRWGEKVFETKDKNGVWDGKYKGEPQPLQTYIYYLSAESIENGKSHMINKVGSVTLIR